MHYNRTNGTFRGSYLLVINIIWYTWSEETWYTVRYHIPLSPQLRYLRVGLCHKCHVIVRSLGGSYCVIGLLHHRTISIEVFLRKDILRYVNNDTITKLLLLLLLKNELKYIWNIMYTIISILTYTRLILNNIKRNIWFYFKYLNS